MRTFLLVATAVVTVVTGLTWVVVAEVRDEQRQRATATYQEVGKLLDCQPIPVAWNEFPKTRIETTKGVFIVSRDVSALKGATVTLSSDGFLFIEGDAGYRIVGR